MEVIGAFTSEYGDTGKHTIDIAYLCRIERRRVRARHAVEKSDAAWKRLDEMPKLAFAGERQALETLRGR